MIPIKDKYKKFGTDPTLEEQIRIYKTEKSFLDRPSGPLAQRIEALSLCGSRWALKKIAVSNHTQAGQRFTWSKTWCDRQKYGYKTRHSYPRSR